MIAVKVIYQLESKHLKQLHSLFQEEWWTETRTYVETIKVVENSSLVVGLVDEEDVLKAFARVLTDYTFKVIIFDVIVAKSERKNGLGKKLMQLILENETLKDVKHFELYCLPEMTSYYKVYGFEDSLDGLVLMRKV